MAKGDDIQERLIEFAVCVLRLAATIPDTPSGRHIAGQLLRSGTSPAANYGEARGAESRNDFVHKLKIVIKELNESQIWLEIVRRSEFVAPNEVTPLLSECVELAKITNASIRTVKSKVNG